MMDENRAAVLNDSTRILSKLQLLSVFFGEDIIYKIYLRTQVIHQLFEHNPELDINKLELFHVQFTNTLVDLLRKIKQNNEKSISLLLDEIQLNKDLAESLQGSVYTRESFRLEQQRQSVKINTSLKKLYEVLSDDSSDYPFSKNINAFSSRFAHDFYYNVPADLIHELTDYQPRDVYANAYAIIQRKLMGQLCKYEFRAGFFCGLRAGDTVLEVYKFNEAERYFSFYPPKGMFLFCDIDKVKSVEWVTESDKKDEFLRELTDKNDRLKNSINITKTTIPAEVKNLLTENYRKLNDINFLQHISEIDAQANILRSMLNTDMI